MYAFHEIRAALPECPCALALYPLTVRVPSDKTRWEEVIDRSGSDLHVVLGPHDEAVACEAHLTLSSFLGVASCNRLLQTDAPVRCVGLRLILDVKILASLR